MTRELASQADSQPDRNSEAPARLSAGFLRNVRAVAEAIFSDASGPPPAERLDWLVDEVEDFLARAGGQTRLVFKSALFALSVLTPLSVLRLTPLARLPLKERVRALSLLERGGADAPVLAVKALLCVLYYEHPDAAAEVGFDGLCMKAES